MSDVVRRGYFQLSTDLFIESLGLPFDTEIIGVLWDFEHQCMEVYVEHPDLNEVEHGEKIPLLQPIITHTKRTWDWNVEEQK